MSKNTVKIKITGYPSNWNGKLGSPNCAESRKTALHRILELVVCTKTARKIGDIEMLDDYQITLIKNSQIRYEKLS